MSNKKKEELRKVPAKNYIALITIFIATFLLAIYLYRYYVVYSEYQKQTPVIRDVIPEITDQELSNYVQESPNTVIYMCTASDDTCRNFEKGLKKVIEQKHLATNITYVNLSDANLEQFTNDFNNKYDYKIKLKNNYPALVVFEDNEIRDIIQNSKKEKLTIDDVEQFLKRNKIGE